MISNYRDAVLTHGIGFYTAELMRPVVRKDKRIVIGGVIFRFDAYRGRVKAIPCCGMTAEPVEVDAVDLFNVKFISPELKALTNSK